MSDRTIAVIGGTGKLGAAIARRLAKAGRKVIIGSRSAENAARTAAELEDSAIPGMTVRSSQAGERSVRCSASCLLIG